MGGWELKKKEREGEEGRRRGKREVSDVMKEGDSRKI